MRTHLTLISVLFLLAAGTATASGDGFGLYGYTAPLQARSASLTMVTGSVTPGAHASVWLGANSADHKSWIQAGIYLDQDGQCVYAEVGSSGELLSRRCLRPIGFGQSVNVRATFSNRHGVVLWVDGKPVASQKMNVERIATDGLGHSRPESFATSETYGPASVQPEIRVLT